MAGAKAPQRTNDPDLQDVVAALLRLSVEERSNLNNYEVSTCDDKLQELVDYVNNPVGKPERTIPDVVGQIFLLHL